jgi:tripeptidyl-peptidase I
MRFSTLVGALASSAALCSAAPPSSARRHMLHEKRDGESHVWTKRERANPDQVLPIRIGLRQRNLENAESYIYEVSDPTSPNFGKVLITTLFFIGIAILGTHVICGIFTNHCGWFVHLGLGKHWTAEQVANTFAPHPETKKAVIDWLVESGISISRVSLSKGR